MERNLVLSIKGQCIPLTGKYDTVRLQCQLSFAVRTLDETIQLNIDGKEMTPHSIGGFPCSVNWLIDAQKLSSKRSFDEVLDGNDAQRQEASKPQQVEEGMTRCHSRRPEKKRKLYHITTQQ